MSNCFAKHYRFEGGEWKPGSIKKLLRKYEQHRPLLEDNLDGKYYVGTAQKGVNTDRKRDGAELVDQYESEIAGPKRTKGNRKSDALKATGPGAQSRNLLSEISQIVPLESLEAPLNPFSGVNIGIIEKLDIHLHFSQKDQNKK